MEISENNESNAKFLLKIYLLTSPEHNGVSLPWMFQGTTATPRCTDWNILMVKLQWIRFDGVDDYNRTHFNL